MIELLLATAWNFSVPEAPYSIDRREEGGAKAVATVSAEEIRVGNRKIRLNGSVLGVMANGRELVNITAWVDGSKNWSQAKDWKVSLLKDGRGVHRTCTVPGAQMKDGEGVTIESDVRVMPNGEIELRLFNPGANPSVAAPSSTSIFRRRSSTTRWSQSTAPRRSGCRRTDMSFGSSASRRTRRCSVRATTGR